MEKDYDSEKYHLTDLIIDVKSKLKIHTELQTTAINIRLKDKSYNIIFLSYKLNTPIHNDNALTQEIETILSDNNSEHKILELRIIFIPPAPKLYQKRIGRYYEPIIRHMAYYCILKWNKPNMNNDIVWLYDIKETNTNINNLCRYKIEQQLYSIKPLQVDKQYTFQIKAYAKTNNNICSIWSEPKIINTPKISYEYEYVLPQPKYLYVSSLLHNNINIKFDPGFVSKDNQQIRYWYKEKNIYNSVPFGIAEHSHPFGGFNELYPITPNTQYQIVVYTENRTEHIFSSESEPLYIKTPIKNFETINYKPQLPNNIYAEYDNENNYEIDIIIFWQLPPNTYGNQIKYEIKIDKNESKIINDLPLHIPIDINVLQIITVVEINNKIYKSEIGFYSITVNDNKIQIAKVSSENIKIAMQPVDNMEEDIKDNENEIRYAVNELLRVQKNYLYMNWKDYKSIYKHEFVKQIKFVNYKSVNNEKYWKYLIRLFERKTENPWKGQNYKNNTDELVKKLTGVLNKMTPKKFDKIAKLTMDIVNEYVNTKEEMNIIIGLILSFSIKQPLFGDQYAQLCSHLVNNSDWVVNENDTDLGQTCRLMVRQQINELFTQHREHTPNKDEIVLEKEKRIIYKQYFDLKKEKRKCNFFAVMVLIAELYNVGLIRKQLIFKGVFGEVLKGPNSIDIEGLCVLFKQCGRKLENESQKYVDKYLCKLSSHAGRFDFRTRMLVDEIKEMRKNNWEPRLKKEQGKTKDESKEYFETEQPSKQSRRNNTRGARGRGRGHRDDYYDNYYDVGDYYDKGYDGHGRRGDRRSQSSMKPRYDKYDDSVIDTSKWKYKRKYSMEKQSVSPSKSYVKKSDNNKRGMNRNKNDRSYGDEDTVYRVKGYIDEYMTSGIIDELLDLGVNDFKVWATVINDGLRDRKREEIGFFIELVLILFEEKILHNKQANFVNIVIKYLVINLDDNCMDCANFVKYVSELFASLCYNQYLNPDTCYNYFIKKYKEYSEYMFAAKKKIINKVIKYSVAELKRLGAKYDLINNVQRKSL